MVQRCRNLKDLRLFHCSMSDEILMALADDNRECIDHISIMCRREEKHNHDDLSAACWTTLVDRCPNTRVTLVFDHTCPTPFYLIPETMIPEIPVRTLRLETFTRVHEEVNMAADYYKGTLEKVVLQALSVWYRATQEVSYLLRKLHDVGHYVVVLLLGHTIDTHKQYEPVYKPVMAGTDQTDWSALPDDILVTVLSYLKLTDRRSASLVCHSWNDAFQAPHLWQELAFWFYLPGHEKKISFVHTYGRYLRTVTIGLNQAVKANRENACKTIEELSKIHKRRMTKVKIIFTGVNPLFYSGIEFLNCLSLLFGAPPKGVEPAIATLQHVDLSCLSVPYDDHLFDILSLNNINLTYLDIQNKVIVCKVTSSCILRLVQRCRNLKDLRLFHCSMADDILMALADDNRECIDHISIMCRREEKYGADLSAACWTTLVDRCPNMRVTLGFDHTCPFHLIPEIMKSEIPVRTLRLETFTRVHEEVNMAADYYKGTLAKLVLQTRNSPDLEDALLNVARKCRLLNSLIVYCIVRKDIIDEIFRLRPAIQESGSYILNSESHPEPWVVVGVEEDDYVQAITL